MSSSERGLRQGALGGFDSVVMAVAGSAPAYSIAATTAVLIGAVGLASPAALLYSAIPMLGIAWAFNYLGRADVNAGASYSWVGRALHPSLGFLSGWALVVSATIFMVAGSLPAGQLTLSLFSEDLANNTALATTVGAVWFLLMVGLVMAGVTVTARAQWIMTGLEVALLVVFAIIGFTRLSDGAGADFSWSWFGFHNFGGISGFAAGALVAAFYFWGWGWDVTANFNEETEGRGRRAGFGGLVGVLTVFVLFELFTILTSVLLPAEEIDGNAGNVLARLGEVILPGPGGKLLIIAVMLSTIATLETTLIQVSRSLFAMGRDHAADRLRPRARDPPHAGLRDRHRRRRLADPVRPLELPGHGGRRAVRRDQRDRPADRDLLRPGGAGRGAGLPPGAVPVGVQPDLHRDLAAGRCGLHVLDLRRGAAHARHDHQGRRHRGTGARADPDDLVLAQGSGLLPHPTAGDLRRPRGRLPGAALGHRGRSRHARTGLAPAGTSPAPPSAGRGRRSSSSHLPEGSDDTRQHGGARDLLRLLHHRRASAPELDEAGAAAIAAEH